MSFSKEKILLVEDEEHLAEGLCFNFEREGFDIEHVADGEQAAEILTARPQDFHAVVLDLMLPGLDGFQILAKARLVSHAIPILVLSAKGTESDKIRALELGADDFVTKPFSLQELILRIRALLKRSQWLRAEGEDEDSSSHRPDSFAISFGSGVFHRNFMTYARHDGELVKMSPTEASLLLVFLRKPNTILSRQQLLKDVWQYEPGTATRTVDVFVGKLRKIIEKSESEPEHLLSVRGAGYVYVTDNSMRESLRPPRKRKP